MSVILKLTRPPQSMHSFKHIIKCAKRNQSISSVAQEPSRLRNIIKTSLIGLTVGAVGTLGYNAYSNMQKSKTYHLLGKEQKVTILKEKPQVPVSRKIVIPTDRSGLKLTLFQYQTCPFCCKVRVFLDYFGISYDVVEVDPVLRNEISWSTYRKVPILLAEVDSGYMPLNDSSMIISLIASHLKDKSDVEELIKFYPSVAMHDNDDNLKYEIMNKYFLMYQNMSITDESYNEITEERNWRKWADDVLVHSLSPNVYRTIGEAYDTFNWFSQIGKWDEYFPFWERAIIINVGALAMWMLSKSLKKRHHLKDDVRQSLYDDVNYWLAAIKQKGGEFMGGDKPNLADLAVYGVLKSIEGCQAFQDTLQNTKLQTWFRAMIREVDSHSGSKLLAK